MKIFQINSSIGNLGSTGSDTEGIGKAAVERGWEAYGAYSRYRTESASKLIKVGNKLTAAVHLLLARLFDAEGYGSVFATKRLIRKIKQVDPDLIILHNLHGYYLNYSILFDYLSKCNKQIIWSLHDCYAFTGHCTYFETVKCEKWKTECHDCPLSKYYPKSMILDKSRRNFRNKKSWALSIPNMTIVTVSDWLKGLAEQSFLGKFPVKRIYNGINVETFRYRDDLMNIYPEKIILFAVANYWSESKGLLDYLKLSKLLPDNYLILLAGTIGDKSIKDNLPDNIINLGRVNDRKVLAQYFSRANITLNLSYQETMGLTSVESMACGTPVVVYDATASPELVTKETGRVVTPGDIPAVAKAINSLLEKEKAEYMEVCRERVLENFEEMSNFRKYLDLYQPKM